MQSTKKLCIWWIPRKVSFGIHTIPCKNRTNTGESHTVPSQMIFMHAEQVGVKVWIVWMWLCKWVHRCYFYWLCLIFINAYRKLTQVRSKSYSANRLTSNDRSNANQFPHAYNVHFWEWYNERIHGGDGLNFFTEDNPRLCREYDFRFPIHFRALVEGQILISVHVYGENLSTVWKQNHHEIKIQPTWNQPRCYRCQSLPRFSFKLPQVW